MGRGADDNLTSDRVPKSPGRSYRKANTADLSPEEVAALEEEAALAKQAELEEKKEAHLAREEVRQSLSEPRSRARLREDSEAERTARLREIIENSLSNEDKMRARLIEKAGTMTYDLSGNDFSMLFQEDGRVGIPVGDGEELFITKRDLKERDGSPFPASDLAAGRSAYVGGIKVRAGNYESGTVSGGEEEAIQSFLKETKNELGSLVTPEEAEAAAREIAKASGKDWQSLSAAEQEAYKERATEEMEKVVSALLQAFGSADTEALSEEKRQSRKKRDK